MSELTKQEHRSVETTSPDEQAKTSKQSLRMATFRSENNSLCRSSYSVDRMRKFSASQFQDLKGSKSTSASDFLDNRVQNLVHILENRRKNKEMDLDISPEVAAIVVKQYLLPMFETDSKHFDQLRRSNMLGKISLDCEKPLEVVRGTVYAELKLSDKLLMELKQVKEELRVAKQKLKDLEQNNKGLDDQLEINQSNYLQVLADLQVLNYQSNQQAQQMLDFETLKVKAQSEIQANKYQDSETQRIGFTGILHEQKAQCDKLKNRNIELEQSNALLRMENDIMGERLKNLYTSINDLVNRKFVEEKVANELQAIAGSVRELGIFHSALLAKQKEILSERDKLQSDLISMTK